MTDSARGEGLDAETRLLAAIAYGESSTRDVYEEMAAIASVMVRQRIARGYRDIATFTSRDKQFSYVVSDGNKRFAKLMKATEAQIENSKALSMAVRAARNAFDNGPDHSNGAYFWDGADIVPNYKKHFKVRSGIRFTDPSHNIYNIEESRWPRVKKVCIEVRRGNMIVKQSTAELGSYDHIYQSTAAHGGTIFWKHNPDYMRVTCARSYI